jgi:hypothetical protein
MGVPKRKPWICLEQDCFVCRGKGICEVPDECQYSVLHALDLTELEGGGLMERPRRWGKSQMIARCAAAFLGEGCGVVVVCLNKDQADNFKKFMKRSTGVCCEVQTKCTFPSWIKGRKSFCVLTDELKPEDVETLKSSLVLGWHDFVLGYYSKAS